MTLTVGFIGFGTSTNRYHLPYLMNREHIRVKTVFNRRRKPVLEEQYAGMEIEFTDQLEDLLDDPDVQLISITTPHHTHYDYAKRSLEKGKHVLVEKPFATSVEEAKELLELAKTKGLVIMPFQNRRFDSDFLTVKEVIANGWLGELVEIESHFDRYQPIIPDVPGDYFEGALYNLGIHLIDQIISLFGMPETVNYDIRSLRNPGNPDDTFELQLFYGELKVILKTSHLVKIPYPTFIVHGKKGNFVKYGMDQQEGQLIKGQLPGSKEFGLDPVEAYGKVVYEDADGNRQEKTVPTILGDYGRVYDAMYESILKGKEKLVSDEHILASMIILEKAFQDKNPKTVHFSEK